MDSKCRQWVDCGRCMNQGVAVAVPENPFLVSFALRCPKVDFVLCREGKVLLERYSIIVLVFNIQLQLALSLVDAD